MGMTTPPGNESLPESEPSSSLTGLEGPCTSSGPLSSPETTACIGGRHTNRSPRRICPECGGAKAPHAITCRSCHTSRGAAEVIQLTCSNCQTTFTRKAHEHEKSLSRHGDGVRTFCQRACYNTYKRTHPESYEKPKGNCDGCGKKLTGQQKKFCSHPCYLASRSRGAEAYNGAFLALKMQVIARDSGCLLCGTQEQLEVHHLDHDPTHNAMGNLGTLCRTCHRAYHRMNDTVQKILREHTVQTMS